MKYIRKFNESITTDIQEFCNNNLAYLIDDGYRIIYRSTGFSEEYWTMGSINDNIDYTSVNITKVDSRMSNFTWHDVRDEFIPFINILSRNYTISSIKFKYNITRNGRMKSKSIVASKHVKLSDIINDRIEDMSIVGIDFNVKNI
jgi:hypothetical protein